MPPHRWRLCAGQLCCAALTLTAPVEIKLKRVRFGKILLAGLWLFSLRLAGGQRRPDMHKMNFAHNTNSAPEINPANASVSFPVAILFILWMIGLALVHLAS